MSRSPQRSLRFSALLSTGVRCSCRSPRSIVSASALTPELITEAVPEIVI